MSTIWLVRHGTPEFKDNIKICLGCRLNPGLSLSGRKEAFRLRSFFDGKHIDSFYSSPLLRSIETASILAKGKGTISILGPLTEMDMGDWEGLSFPEIKSRYPELYEKRERDHSIVPPNGESYSDAAERMLEAVRETEGDSVLVGHLGAIRALLCLLTDTPYSQNRSFGLPYGSVSQLCETDEGYKVVFWGKVPERYPDMGKIQKLYERYGTPPNVIAHCQAVAHFARELACKMKGCGYEMDSGLVYAAGLLHDLCRTKKNHPQTGADAVLDAGYPDISDIIGSHHTAPEIMDGGIGESEVLFLADKFFIGDKHVTIEERFNKSREKCSTEEARRNHKAQLDAAMKIKSLVEKMTGMKL